MSISDSGSNKHLSFKANPEALNYKGTGRGSFPQFTPSSRGAHFTKLRRQLDIVKTEFSVLEEKQEESDEGSPSIEFGVDQGLVLNIESIPGYPLKYQSLEKPASVHRPAITLLNLRHEDTPFGIITKAAIFVPNGELIVLENKLAKYSDPSKDGMHGPANADLINNIKSIGVAAMEALWTDPEHLPQSDAIIPFELWIRREAGNDWRALFEAECQRLEINASDQILVFPDYIVFVAATSRSVIESSLDLLNCLSEVRKARPCSVGLTDLGSLEQDEYVNEALDRISWPSLDAPSVCILDTGVNRLHPLIEPILSESDMTTVFPDNDFSDEWTGAGHGTPMSGLAAFGDLRSLMVSTETWNQLHRLESVKFIRSTTPHDADNYGAVTRSAIYEVEAKSPGRKRVFCMAVTAPGPNTEGNPSAWSSAVDMLAAGSAEGDGYSRVILVSAGNTEDHEPSFNYPEDTNRATVQDPAQAWNAIIVGAYTARTNIEESDDEALRSVAIAPEHSVSPFSTTSHDWRPDWPIRPDIVMEGGNLGRDERNDCLKFDSLQPLSTSKMFRHKALCPFNATSAATAQAARIAAMLCEKYPQLTTESIKGLLVHSAEWPEELLTREDIQPHRSGGSANIQNLMRSVGYGVVNEERALNSVANQVTFITESSIQPYKGTAGAASFNQSHMYELPWPKVILESLQDASITLKVTLSYFIEPNPGSKTWDNGQKYKYASHLLGFKPKTADISLDDFKAKLNADVEDEVELLSDSGWALGPKLRGKCGAIVQDVWQGSAINLASMEAIAVFPRARGWWATRKYIEDRVEHGCHTKSVPYSLIISIESEVDVDLYAAVQAQIVSLGLSIDNTAQVETSN